MNSRKYETPIEREEEKEKKGGSFNVPVLVLLNCNETSNETTKLYIIKNDKQNSRKREVKRRESHHHHHHSSSPYCMYIIYIYYCNRIYSIISWSFPFQFFSTIDLQKREVYFLRRNLYHYNIYKNEKSNRHAAKRGNLKVFIICIYM